MISLQHFSSEFSALFFLAMHIKAGKRFFGALVIFSLFFSAAFSEEEQKLNSQEESKFNVAGIPALSFDSDRGFGLGLIGSFNVKEKDYSPYKMAIDAQGFLTVKGVHSHYIRLDLPSIFHKNLRLIGQLGFYSTLSQNYCGLGSSANCNESRAIEGADNLGLKGSDREKFVGSYYKNRFIKAYGGLYSRLLLGKYDLVKLEFMTSYRGSYYLNRDFKEKGPYKNSLFEKEFKNEKIDGFLSTAEVGLMLDSRDNESAPNSGYWLETSIRGASSIIGSAWDFIGLNLALRFYVPIIPNRTLILASQTIFDGIVGDLPLDAMAKIGGSQSLYDYGAFGGQFMGRGIRDQLFVGRFKAIEQLEIRYMFYSFNLFSQNFDLVLAGLGDLGFIALDKKNFYKDMKNIQIGFGGGFRIYWNQSFVIRTDLAFSPKEDYGTRFYLVVGNVF